MPPKSTKRKSAEAAVPRTPEGSPSKLPKVSALSLSPAAAAALSPALNAKGRPSSVAPPSPLDNPPMGLMSCVVVVTAGGRVTVEQSKDRAAKAPVHAVRFIAEDDAGSWAMFCLEYPCEAAAGSAAAIATTGATLRVSGVRSVHVRQLRMKELMPRFFLAVARKPASLTVSEHQLTAPSRSVNVRGQDLLGGNIPAIEGKGRVTILCLVTSASAPYSLAGEQARDLQTLTPDGSTMEVTLLGRHARMALLQRPDNRRPVLLLENATFNDEYRAIAVDCTSATCNDAEHWPSALKSLMDDLAEARAPADLETTVSDVDILRDPTRALGWLAAREEPCPFVSPSMTISSHWSRAVRPLPPTSPLYRSHPPLKRPPPPPPPPSSSIPVPCLETMMQRPPLQRNCGGQWRGKAGEFWGARPIALPALPACRPRRERRIRGDFFPPARRRIPRYIRPLPPTLARRPRPRPAHPITPRAGAPTRRL